MRPLSFNISRNFNYQEFVFPGVKKKKILVICMGCFSTGPQGSRIFI